MSRDSRWTWPGGDDLDRRHDVMGMLTHPMFIEGIGHVPAAVQPRPGTPNCDQELRLVRLICPPCQDTVALIFSAEVGRRLPGHLPYLWVQTQHGRGSTDPATGRPRFRVVETLLHSGGNEVLQVVAAIRDAVPPEQLHTTCPRHGRLWFTRRDALRQARKSRHAIIAAELRGDTPRMGRWYLARAGRRVA